MDHTFDPLLCTISMIIANAIMQEYAPHTIYLQSEINDNKLSTFIPIFLRNFKSETSTISPPNFGDNYAKL